MNDKEPSDRWRQVSRICAGALARETAERAAFLQEACAGDDALRREVESLLANESQAAAFLTTPAGAAAAQLMTQENPQGFDLAGWQLGSYKILAPLGRGGMGEVYRARDAKLGRDVAIKILPRAFTSDPERLTRFEREARVLASLNHPHIGAIYGVQDADGIRALVLELIEGETLAERIARGSRAGGSKGPGLPMIEALTIAQQIAEALEAAHAKSIIHRDLKPANIKITPSGVVKVLDFGLAKAGGDGSPSDLSQAPTITVGGTREGLILGTAAYMSPEQARGQVVDKRTDIWAFGCVLYEMLTGRPTFPGETISDTIAAILEREPHWQALPTGTPPSVRRLLQRCLEKEASRRLRDIGDARVEFEDALDARRAPGRPAYLTAGLIVVALVLLAGGVGLFYATKPSRPVTSPSEYTQITNFTDAAMAPSFSPDGRMVAFKRGTNSAQAGAVEDFLGAGQIYVKLLPNGESVQLTNGRSAKYGPVFTPDGSRVAYTQVTFSGSSVAWDTWTVPMLGGQPTRLLPNASGLTWIGSQRVLFSEITTGLHMGIVTATEARAEERAIYFPPLELGMAHYSYASPDHASILVVEMANTHAFDSPCRLVPFDGRSAGRPVGPSGTCLSAAWSPDGKWMYFAADVGGNVHLWRQRFPNGSPEPMTFGTNQEQGIAVAPDGRSLITSIGRRLSTIWIHDAAGERAITSEGYTSAPRVSADGTHAFYLDSATSSAFSPAGPAPAGELRTVDLASGKIESVLPGMVVADYDISLDGRDVAFTTRDSGGESQIWLAPLDRRSGPRQMIRSADQVSFGPRGELLFRVKDKNVNVLYRMDRDGSGRERITSPAVLIKYGVSPDGEWVTAAVPVADGHKESSGMVSVPTETVAIPVHGGPLRRICRATCRSSWSSDGRFFYAAVGDQTRVIPVPAGKSLPDLPASGLSVENAPDEPHGARNIQRDGVVLGPDPSTYVFRRTELHANLFRIPLH
jgi:Tol biopolymer transport system component